jgi:GT2 family glycosyltransferase
VSVPDQQASRFDARLDDHADGVGETDLGEAPDVSTVPPVVIAIVAHDPGDWFEQMLQSVSDQRYRNTSVLVLDTGGDPALRARVARTLPDAHYRAVPDDHGFGHACNEVLSAVEGAAFYLFCHDDVQLAPDAVSAMVEEAFRSNAGIVGPKIVEWADHRRLLSVGMGADKTGYPAPYVERGELDQSQHDSVRDVFYVPGAATLVRADLFRALDGFDEGIDFHADDLDLCWRARVAGARVVVAPAASVAHLEALGLRRPIDDRRRLQMRHRLRAMRVSYRWPTRVRVLLQAAVLALLEICYSLVLGRFRHARDVAGAWIWNLRGARGIRAQRRHLKAVRKLPDREVRRRQVGGSARLSAFLRGQIGSSEDRLPVVAGVPKGELTDTLRSSKASTALVAWVLVMGFVALGSRDLIFGRISAIGDMPFFGDRGFDLIEQWTSGYNAVGLGAVEANPTLLGLTGALGAVLLNSLGVLRKLMILGMVPLGLAGVWRLGKPVGSRRSRIVALIVYAAVPVPYNAIATGEWGALVLYGLAPWISSHLVKATGLAPYGSLGGAAGPGIRSRPLVQRVVAVGVLTGLAAMVLPVALVIVPAVAAAFVIGGLLAGQLAGAWRLLVVGIGGAAVGAVLQFPWSQTFLTADWSVLAGTSSATTSSSGQALDVGAILRFDTGPLGSGVLSYLFLAAAALALLIGREWRLSWSVRAWVLAASSFAVVWVQSQGWLPADAPSATILLVPAAVGLALAAAMGMAAFEVDLPDYHFGWRQILSVLAGAALVLAVTPAVGASIDGRWEQPRGDYARTLSFLDREGEQEPLRVLWLGDAATLPLGAWEVDPGGGDELGPGTRLAFATSEDGMPGLAERWVGAPGEATDHLTRVLRSAVEGGTSRLGALLAPMGVRYLVVVAGPAPEPFAPPTGDIAPLESALDAQLDLVPVTASGVTLYRNSAWGPVRATLPPGTAIPSGELAQDGATLPAVEGAPVALPETRGYQDFAGPVEPSVVHLGAAASSRWVLEVDGETAERSDSLGWANAFDVREPGDARLRFDTPNSYRAILALQVLLWIAAVGYLLRVRVVRDERRTIEAENEPSEEQV